MLSIGRWWNIFMVSFGMNSSVSFKFEWVVGAFRNARRVSGEKLWGELELVSRKSGEWRVKNPLKFLRALQKCFFFQWFLTSPIKSSVCFNRYIKIPFHLPSTKFHNLSISLHLFELALSPTKTHFQVKRKTFYKVESLHSLNPKSLHSRSSIQFHSSRENEILSSTRTSIGISYESALFYYVAVDLFSFFAVIVYDFLSFPPCYVAHLPL